MAVDTGGVPPAVAGELIVQSEDLGAWIGAQRTRWGNLMPAHPYLLEALGIEAAVAGEAAVPAPRTQGDRWTANITAAPHSTPAKAAYESHVST